MTPPFNLHKNSTQTINQSSDTSVGWSWASLTPKASSRGEAFPHTYKLTTSPFHNRCGTTPTISPSHIGPWVGAATTRFSRGLLGRDLLVNLGSDTSVGWSWASLTPKASSRGEAFPHTYKLTTSPFHNRCGTTPTKIWRAHHNCNESTFPHQWHLSFFTIWPLGAALAGLFVVAESTPRLNCGGRPPYSQPSFIVI
jgi:hypothetical protein